MTLEDKLRSELSFEEHEEICREVNKAVRKRLLLWPNLFKKEEVDPQPIIVQGSTDEQDPQTNQTP